MSQPSYNNIQFKLTDGLAVLARNRPDRLNSFNSEKHDEVNRSGDYREGITAFMAKRAPNYRLPNYKGSRWRH